MLTIKKPEGRHWLARRSGVFIVNFEQVKWRLGILSENIAAKCKNYRKMSEKTN